MGFIIYSIIVQFGWKSRECTSTDGDGIGDSSHPTRAPLAA